MRSVSWKKELSKIGTEPTMTATAPEKFLEIFAYFVVVVVKFKKKFFFFFLFFFFQFFLFYFLLNFPTTPPLLLNFHFHIFL